MALTGRFTFRRTLTGKIVLQLEEEVKAMWPKSRKSPFTKRWRNATLMDLASPELRPLMDLRYKPQFMAQYDYLASETRTPPAAAAPDGFDGMPVGQTKILHGARAIRADDRLPEVTVEVESYNGRISGRA